MRGVPEGSREMRKVDVVPSLTTAQIVRAFDASIEGTHWMIPDAAVVLV